MLCRWLFVVEILALFLQLRVDITAAGKFIVHKYKNKVLVGHNYRNITSVGLQKCLESCLAECRCLSFQICAAPQDCQLSSSKKLLNESSFEDSEECDYVEFQNKDMTKPKLLAEKCRHIQCMANINCCLTSTPCYNGGTCIPSASHLQRFTCKCSPGFQGQFCQRIMKSCADYKDGERIPGNYPIVDNKGNTYMVFCDFNKKNSEGGMSWTLIQSYSLENKDNFASPFTVDNPENEENFTWFGYRLSYERIAYIHEHSVKWRITCNYETNGISYTTDYVRALILDVPLFKLSGNHGECVQIQRITVRGASCLNCKARMVQSNELPLYFDGLQSAGCGFHIPNIAYCADGEIAYGEQNFGNYICKNPEHSCSSSPSATTQTWLGSA